MVQVTTFYCREDILWAKDYDNIVIISLAQNVAHTLEGVEATIWEYLTLGYSQSKLTTQLSSIFSISPELASTTIVKTLISWEKKDLVRR